MVPLQSNHKSCYFASKQTRFRILLNPLPLFNQHGESQMTISHPIFYLPNVTDMHTHHLSHEISGIADYKLGHMLRSPGRDFRTSHCFHIYVFSDVPLVMSFKLLRTFLSSIPEHSCGRKNAIIQNFPDHVQSASHHCILTNIMDKHLKEWVRTSYPEGATSG